MKTVFKQLLLPVIYGIFVAVMLLMPLQLCAPVYAQEPEAECWAVIVGVSEYKYYSDLNYPDDDARELSQQLSPIWGDDHVKLLTDSAATKQGIQNAITGWLAAREDTNDTVLFFWAGYRLSSGYLIPHDSLTDSYDNDISADELGSWLDTLDSERIVVMNISPEEFLDVLGGTGRIILASSAPGENSWTVSDLEHGVFPYYILEALREFDAADSDKNLELSVEEIFDYAQSRTINYTMSDPDLTTQHPQVSDRYGGQLSLLMEVTADVESDAAQNIPILNIAGETYSSGELPVSFIWAPGSSHDFELVSSVSGGSGIQYVFSSWDDGNTSASRAISEGGVYTANYKTQYYLTVESAYGQPNGDGWYDSGSTATISVTSPEGTIIRQVFTGWSGDLSDITAAASVTMDGPKTVTAGWRTDYMQLYMIIGGGAVIIGALVVMLVMKGRRKKIAVPAPVKEAAQPPTPSVCASCGAEIEPGDAFCTKCGEPVQD